VSGALVVARIGLLRLFAGPVGWGIVAVLAALHAWWLLAAVDGFLAVADELAARPGSPGVGDLVVAPFLAGVASSLLVVAPLVAMRAIAGEVRERRLPWLLASVGSDAALVVGQWLAATLTLTLVVGLAIGMTLTLAAGTTLDLARLGVSALGLVALAAFLAALAVLASAWVRQAPAAAMLALALGVLLWIADAQARARGETEGLIQWIAIPGHLQPFLRGVIDTSALAYFALGTTAFLWLATRRVAASRREG
jgi:ABC-2 type transport system permease protein